MKRIDTRYLLVAVAVTALAGIVAAVASVNDARLVHDIVDLPLVTVSPPVPTGTVPVVA